MAVMVTEPKYLTGIRDAIGEQSRDLTLVAAADHLRGLAGPLDVVARIGEQQFGIGVIETSEETIEAALGRFRNAASGQGLILGSAIFHPDRPVTLDTLLEQAERELTPHPVPPRPKSASLAARSA
jgi:GGDEF domain-containing protein